MGRGCLPKGWGALGASKLGGLWWAVEKLWRCWTTSHMTCAMQGPHLPALPHPFPHPNHRPHHRSSIRTRCWPWRRGSSRWVGPLLHCQPAWPAKRCSTLLSLCPPPQRLFALSPPQRLLALPLTEPPPTAPCPSLLETLHAFPCANRSAGTPTRSCTSPGPFSTSLWTTRGLSPALRCGGWLPRCAGVHIVIAMPCVLART